MWDALWLGGPIATMTGSGCGLVENGAVAVEGGRIAWIGPKAALPGEPAGLAAVVHDLGGRLLTPGLVDCHTHVVHVGERSADFALRVAGADRAAITNAGGGVRGTMRAVRAASEEQLFGESRRRILRLIAEGVTTLESKSGYGLDLDAELRCLRVSRALGRRLPVTVKATFLGAHGVAPEYDGRPDDYIDFVSDTVLPAAVREGLVDAVDGFCDSIGFTHAQIGRLYERAGGFGLPIKCHADQYSDFSAGAVVARYKGLSADHLEYASAPTVRAMAEAGTVAVLLPGAHWMLAETKRPPVAAFRAHGVPIAIATNCNPGSSPTTSPTTMMHMACRLFGLTPDEALAGFTREGARALGLADRGRIEPGLRADFAIWDVAKPAELSYRIGVNPCAAVVKDGRVVYEAAAPRIEEQS